MTNLDMNSTSNSQWSTVNTDGVDTWNSKDIVISNWTVTCGDVSCQRVFIIFLARNNTVFNLMLENILIATPIETGLH